MAKKLNENKVIVKKNPTKHKIIVEQGRAMGTPYVPHKVLYTEIVPDKETAKTREKELREEYKDTDALSIVSFSL
jgi:hypothetical protein